MTTIYNAVLIKYAGGHTYVDRAGGGPRRELYIEMGTITDRQQARELGAQFLALSRDSFEDEAVSAQFRPIDVVSGSEFQMGDSVLGARVNGATYTLTEDGGATASMDLGDRRRIRLDALNRQLQRAGAGMSTEFGAPAPASATTGGGDNSLPPPFSQSGDTLQERTSPPWPVPRPFRLSWVHLEVDEAGWLDTRVRVLRRRRGVNGGNATVLANVTLPAGDFVKVQAVGLDFAAGDRLLYRLVQDGGAKELSVKSVGAFP